jgi:TonB family protein
MYKDPKHDLRLQYKSVVEVSMAITLTLIIIMLMIYKKFEVDINLSALDAPAIQVEDIPITRTVKKLEVPKKPVIPVEDPDIDPEEDVEIDIPEDFELDIDAPPPPPAEDETVPFFKVELKPQLTGGVQAISSYIVKHNLFPETAQLTGIKGVALVTFIVDKNGIPQDVKIKQVKPPDMGFGEAAVTVMKAMRFSPGMQRDKPVNVPMQQKITFSAR